MVGKADPPAIVKTPRIPSTPESDALALAPVTPPAAPGGFVARHAFPILLLGLLFAAFSPIFVRLSEIGPIATGFNRMILPLPLFFALLWLRPADRIPVSTKTGRHDLWLVLLSGLFFAGDLTFWNSSVMTTSVANASVLANMTPIFVVGAGWLLFKEKPGRLFVVGMLVALAGSAIMMRESLSLADRSITGDLMAMCASAFYAGYVLTLSRVRKRVSIMATMALGCAASAVVLLPLAMGIEDQLWPQTTNGWLAMAGLVLFVQFGGQMLIAMSLAHVSAGLVSMMFLTQPLIPAVVAWVLFDESITITQLIGAAALLVGLEISRRGTAK